MEILEGKTPKGTSIGFVQVNDESCVILHYNNGECEDAVLHKGTVSSCALYMTGMAMGAALFELEVNRRAKLEGK